MSDGSVTISSKFDNTGFQKGLGSLQGIASKFSSGLKTAFKVGSAAVGTAAAGVIALGKASVQSYAQLEQNIGGIETLFGAKGAKSVEEYAQLVGKSVDQVSDEYDALMKSQNLALDNAKNAYKKAGLSANEYMSTITSFAASLKQSTKSEYEAAEIANQAVIDMSDNANKMRYRHECNSVSVSTVLQNKTIPCLII